MHFVNRTVFGWRLIEIVSLISFQLYLAKQMQFFLIVTVCLKFNKKDFLYQNGINIIF